MGGDEMAAQVGISLSQGGNERRVRGHADRGGRQCTWGLP